MEGNDCAIKTTIITIMSLKHLCELRKGLEKAKWIINEELPENGYDSSAAWVVSRPNGDSSFTLIFEGLGDESVLPIEKSYACHIEGNKGLSLYFGDLKKPFSAELADFIKQLSSDRH